MTRAPATPELAVVRRRLDELTLDPANARTHDPRNLNAIRSSLERFGQVEPIVVQKSTGRVIGGNGRVAVLREMGVGGVDLVEVDVDDLNATALGIALNRSAELAGWDDDALGRLLAELQQAPDFDHSVAGFTDAEITRLLDPVSGETDPDQVPEPPVDPVTKPGDLWVLGEHRLLCGDATNAEDVARVLDGELPFQLVTDPPYGVEYDPAWRARSSADGGLGSSVRRTEAVLNDDRSDWRAAYRLFPGDVAYVWHASLHSWDVAEGLLSASLQIRAGIVWAKPSLQISRGHYHWQHEPCWYAVRKGRPAAWCGDRKQSTVWNIARADDTGSTTHSTQKPVECMERPMRNHGKPGDLVYDPFLGSGTSVIAATRARRRCAGVELDPAWCDVSVDRWENYTGEKAERRPA